MDTIFFSLLALLHVVNEEIATFGVALSESETILGGIGEGHFIVRDQLSVEIIRPALKTAIRIALEMTEK